MSALPAAVVCGLFLGPIGSLSAIWAVICMVRGDFLSATAALGFAAFCFGFIVPFFKVVPGNIRPRAEFDENGTTFRPDRGIDVPIAVSLLGLAIGGGMLAVFKPIGQLDIPVPEQMRLSIPFTGGVAAVAIVPILVRTLRRGGSKYLRLTPEGFEIAQGWAVKRGRWADVKDVTDDQPGQSKPTPAAIAIGLADGSWLAVAGASFVPNGDALRKLVRFYWQNPKQRNELTDDRAINRLRRAPAR
ncbi:MAG: hypothetical protein QOJ80_3749 [Mycobacterium sp.]|nr:hypothetical protein [Mycobacterium sp.]